MSFPSQYIPCLNWDRTREFHPIGHLPSIAKRYIFYLYFIITNILLFVNNYLLKLGIILVLFYFLNITMVGLDIIMYFRNVRLDRQNENK